MADPRQRYEPLIRQTAEQYGVDPTLALAVAEQESRFDPEAVSPAGARGIFQLMPQTAEALGVDPNHPVQNIAGGIRLLREELDRFGDEKLALAAYNAGSPAVREYGGIPPFEETQKYVPEVLERRSRYQGGPVRRASAEAPKAEESRLDAYLRARRGGKGTKTTILKGPNGERIKMTHPADASREEITAQARKVIARLQGEPKQGLMERATDIASSVPAALGEAEEGVSGAIEKGAELASAIPSMLGTAEEKAGAAASAAATRLGRPAREHAEMQELKRQRLRRDFERQTGQELAGTPEEAAARAREVERPSSEVAVGPPEPYEPGIEQDPVGSALMEGFGYGALARKMGLAAARTVPGEAGEWAGFTAAMEELSEQAKEGGMGPIASEATGIAGALAADVLLRRGAALRRARKGKIPEEGVEVPGPDRSVTIETPQGRTAAEGLTDDEAKKLADRLGGRVVEAKPKVQEMGRESAESELRRLTRQFREDPRSITRTEYRRLRQLERKAKRAEPRKKPAEQPKKAPAEGAETIRPGSRVETPTGEKGRVLHEIEGRGYPVIVELDDGTKKVFSRADLPGAGPRVRAIPEEPRAPEIRTARTETPTTTPAAEASTRRAPLSDFTEAETQGWLDDIVALYQRGHEPGEILDMAARARRWGFGPDDLTPEREKRLVGAIEEVIRASEQAPRRLEAGRRLERSAEELSQAAEQMSRRPDQKDFTRRLRAQEEADVEEILRARPKARKIREKKRAMDAALVRHRYNQLKVGDPVMTKYGPGVIEDWVRRRAVSPEASGIGVAGGGGAPARARVAFSRGPYRSTKEVPTKEMLRLGRDEPVPDLPTGRAGPEMSEEDMAMLRSAASIGRETPTRYGRTEVKRAADDLIDDAVREKGAGYGGPPDRPPPGGGGDFGNISPDDPRFFTRTVLLDWFRKYSDEAIRNPKALENTEAYRNGERLFRQIAEAASQGKLGATDIERNILTKLSRMWEPAPTLAGRQLQQLSRVRGTERASKAREILSMGKMPKPVQEAGERVIASPTKSQWEEFLKLLRRQSDIPEKIRDMAKKEFERAGLKGRRWDQIVFDFWRGMLTGQVATAMRNLWSQGVMYNLDIVDEHLVSRILGTATGTRERLKALFRPREARETTAKVLRDFPVEEERAYGWMLGDIPTSTNISREQNFVRRLQKNLQRWKKTTKGLFGPNEEGLKQAADDWSQATTDTVQTLNRSQEIFTRRAAGDGYLRQLLRRDAELAGMKTDDEIERYVMRKLENPQSLPYRYVKSMVDKQLYVSFAQPPKGEVAQLATRMLRKAPVLYALTVTFPRFVFGNALPFLMDHNPMGALRLLSRGRGREMMKARRMIRGTREKQEQALKAMREGKTDLLDWEKAEEAAKITSRAFTGSLMLAAGIGARFSPLAGARWYEMKTSPEDRMPVNLLAYAPLTTPYLFMGEVIRQIATHGTETKNWTIAPDDFYQGILAFQRMAGTARVQMGAITGDIETAREGFEELIGQFIGGFTVPVRTWKDVIAGLEPTEKAIREPEKSERVYRDIEQMPGGESVGRLVGPTLENIPGASRAVGMPPKFEATQPKPIVKEQPLLRQMTGITRREVTPLEETLEEHGLGYREVYPKTGVPKLDQRIAEIMGPAVDDWVSKIAEHPQFRQGSFEERRTALMYGIPGFAPGISTLKSAAREMAEQEFKGTPDERLLAEKEAKMRARGWKDLGKKQRLRRMLETTE